MKRILLIGSGELGSRFLQAIVKIGNGIIIDIVEPNDSAIEIAKNRILDINNLYFICDTLERALHKLYNTLNCKL